MIASIKNLKNSLLTLRKIKAKAELYNGSALINTFTQDDKIIDFTVDRTGEEGKFFGFEVCHKLKLKLWDKDKELDITSANSFKIYMAAGDDAEFVRLFADFYVTDVQRDEKTNALTIVCEDMFTQMQKHTVAELPISPPYTVEAYARACAAFVGIDIEFKNVDSMPLSVSYETGANFDGTETIREAIRAVAEVTQSICYITGNKLVFKKLTPDNNGVEISKAMYMELKTGENRKLTAICNATELGDNVTASLGEDGVTQYVRDNPFWDIRDDAGALVDNALANIGGLTIHESKVTWRGIFLLEIGDIYYCQLKENNYCEPAYLVNDSLTYNGGMKQTTTWSYEDKGETASNPSTLGAALKQTYARVDKANKQIELAARETQANSDAIASLQINTENINASVEKVQSTTNDALNSINDGISTLSEKVEATMSADEINIKIETELANGAQKVVTSTGFTFDDVGLTVEKANSEMKTTITEDGMQVFKNNEAVLTANNVGVNAKNLHAVTYLIIGTNSRLEDFGNNRTGCFWIGE